MAIFTDNVVKNKGLKIDGSTQGNSADRLYLVETPLSLMEMQTIYNLRIDGELYFFSIGKLPISNKIFPKASLLISGNESISDENKITLSQSELGKNIFKKGNNYFNSVEGFFIRENNLFQILPVIKNASFSVTVSNDGMTVSCNFFPPAKGSANISLDSILLEFRKLKITASPNTRLLDKIIKELEFSDEAFYNVVIAKGTNPAPGKDGWVEFLIETDKSNRPSLTANGRVDFYNLNTIHSVKENEKLAIIHPPIPGTAGVDVLGRITPPEPAKPATAPQGTNTYFNDKSPNILLAKIGGYISKINGKLNITDEYKVHGNIDFHTGNIISEGAVNINGDVKSGFKLDMDKSIIINGFVNDANIKSKGTISITGGFGGSGKGIMDAAGDVSVKFIRNQSIRSDSDIIIAKEAVDASLYAKGNIKSLNGKTIIIGGSIVAEMDVDVNTLGNEFGVKTKVQVGLDLKIIEKYKSLSKSIKKLKLELKEKELRVRKYSNIKNLTINAKKQLADMVTEYKNIKSEYDQLSNEAAEIKAFIKAPSKSVVKVSGFVYPGVEIKIKDSVYIVKEKLRNKTFYMSATENGVIEIK